MKSVGKADEELHSFGYHRSAIEPHSQDQYRKETDILIDADRDVLEWLLKNKINYAHSIIDTWSNSEIPILMRLAIYGFTESSQFTADEKINWLLEKNWLYVYVLNHEVFRLLNNAYPEASESSRLRLLEQIEQLSEEGNIPFFDQEKQERLPYRIYNLLSWLHQAAPDCSLASQRLEAIQQIHPHFSPREYPDLDHWISSRGGLVGDDSPVTVDELLAKNPKEEIDWLLTYQEQGDWGSRRGHLLAVVTKAVARSFEWSWELVQA